MTTYQILLLLFLLGIIALHVVIYRTEDPPVKLSKLLNDTAKRLTPILITSTFLFACKKPIYDFFIRGTIDYEYDCTLEPDENPAEIWICRIVLKNTNNGSVSGRVLKISATKSYDTINNCLRKESKNIEKVSFSNQVCTYILNLGGMDDFDFEMRISGIEKPSINFEEVN